jgi:hypothetical protein
LGGQGTVEFQDRTINDNGTKSFKLEEVKQQEQNLDDTATSI